MKKIILLFVSLFTFAQVRAQELPTMFKIMETGVTNMALNSTNTTVGIPIQMGNFGKGTYRLYLTAASYAASTNGSLIVKFSSASGNFQNTNTFDSAGLSAIKLTLTPNGAGTNTVSDWFVSRGQFYLRQGQVENTSSGSFSNIVIRVGY